MLPPIFYIKPDSINDKFAVLDEEESKHAVRVLRLSKGAVVVLIDGLGNAFKGEITRTGTKSTDISIHSTIRNFGEPKVKLTLAAGLSTNYKFDTVIEKGTEIGVSRFVPLLTEKSKIKLDDPKRAKTKINRYQKIARAAVKQCRRSYIPEICQPRPFKDYLREIDKDTLNIIFHPGENSQNLYNLKIDNDIRRVNLIVGPESGFSPEEIDSAQAADIKSVSLGKRILRTETASIVVSSLLMNQLGELS